MPKDDKRLGEKENEELDGLDDISHNKHTKRTEELKRQANEFTGPPIASYESEDLSPELAEEFWHQVVEYESAPLSTHFQRLQSAGVDLPAPEAMDDVTLKAKLWEIIEKLGKMRV